MKPPRLPGLRKVLAGLAAARTDGAAPPLDQTQLELERRLACRARQTRERRLRKLMGSPEPPERALTRQAMEQMRFLRRTFPEEWPVARLAQGFGAPPEVVRRVLKSRFCPSPERGRKQDARANPDARAGRPPVPRLPAQPPLVAPRPEKPPPLRKGASGDPRLPSPAGFQLSG